MTDEQLDQHLESTERPAGEAGTTTTTPEAQETTESRAADVTGEPGPIPYHRFKEVNDAASRYKSLGKPDEIEARLAKLAAIEQQEAEQVKAQATAEARKANPKLADAEDLIEETVRKRFPGVADAVERQREQEKLVVESHVQRGFEAIPAMLKAHNLRTDADTVQSYETLIESQILKDDTLKRDFWSPAKQAGAITEAFNRVKAKLINPALQAAGARTLDDARDRRARTLDRAAPGGTAVVKPQEFVSKHPIGSAGYDRDRATWRSQLIDAHLDAMHFDDESVSL